MYSKPDYTLLRKQDRRHVHRARWIRPPKSNSDHRALVMRVELEPGGAKAHVRRRKRFPFTLLQAKRSGGEKLFDQLMGKVDTPPHRSREENAWICPGTWALVDERSKLRQLRRLTQAEGRRLGRRIHAALKADRAERARKAGEQVMGHLEECNPRAAWRTLGAWYKTVSGRAGNPCYHRMERQTAEREQLYAHVPPPGQSIPKNADRPPQMTPSRPMRRFGTQ